MVITFAVMNPLLFSDDARISGARFPVHLRQTSSDEGRIGCESAPVAPDQ
jgi:hypothetical protein